ncbi:hypothetical protein D9M72_594790 [compost metagenome]
MIEMVDRFLQFLKEALLFGTLIGNVGNLPGDQLPLEVLSAIDWTRFDAIPDWCGRAMTIT